MRAHAGGLCAAPSASQQEVIPAGSSPTELVSQPGVQSWTLREYVDKHRKGREAEAIQLARTTCPRVRRRRPPEGAPSPAFLRKPDRQGHLARANLVRVAQIVSTFPKLQILDTAFANMNGLEGLQVRSPARKKLLD